MLTFFSFRHRGGMIRRGKIRLKLHKMATNDHIMLSNLAVALFLSFPQIRQHLNEKSLFSRIFIVSLTYLSFFLNSFHHVRNNKKSLKADYKTKQFNLNCIQRARIFFPEKFMSVIFER